MDYGILSITIPLLTIALAIITKDVIVSLMGGIFAGFFVIHGYDPTKAFTALWDGVIALFAQGWIVKTLLFMLFVGAVIRLLTISNAVDRFVVYLSQTSKHIDSPKGAMFLAYIIGLLIFIESSITSLVAGAVSKPLCDKNGVSREKLAYICDSTSAPVCSLIPLNGWGALLLGLIMSGVESHVIEGDAVTLLIYSIPYNFYSIFTLLVVFAVILFDINIGPMKRSIAKPYTLYDAHQNIKPSFWMMTLPVVFIVTMVPVVLYITGDGDIFKGSGSTSVYYATIATLFFLYLFLVPLKRVTHKEYFDNVFIGMAEMLPVTTILVFALLIGKVIDNLGTAHYLSTLLQGNISSEIVPMLIFWVASLTSFSTGTSWGTFSIMMPIGLALGATLHLDLPLVIAAVISGGVFGDHASPISDTTIISSMAAECDHIEHVRTQLPYTLIAGGFASVAFLLFGFLGQ